MSKISVFCMARSRGRADRIVNDLKEATIPATDISLVFLDRTPHSGSGPAPRSVISGNTDSPESMSEIRGVMASISGVRHLAIAGIDPLIVAGPIAAALSVAMTGGLAGGLVDFGLPKAESDRYASSIMDGHILISVHAENPDQSDQARAIFIAAGAADICTIIQVSTPRLPSMNGGGVPHSSVV